MKGYHICKTYSGLTNKRMEDFKKEGIEILFMYKHQGHTFGLFQEEMTKDKAFLFKDVNECIKNYTIPGFKEAYREEKLKQLLNK